MKITIGWTESVDYVSEVEIDENAFRSWVATGQNKNPADVKITSDSVREYLQSGDEAGWFEQCNAARDCIAVNERSITDVLASSSPEMVWD